MLLSVGRFPQDFLGLGRWWKWHGGAYSV